jgi:hypothetical protein
MKVAMTPTPKTRPASSDTITLRALNRATLARQVLLAREKVTPLTVIERLAGLQAQWPMPPFVGLWSRVHGFQRKDLARLFEKRDAVRATMMRGTIHVVSARDYVALRPIVTPVLERGMSSILRGRGAALDVDTIADEARALLAKGPATFGAIRDHLASLHPQGDHRAMGLAVRMRLALVMVPSDARWAFPADSAFTLAEPWLRKKLKATGEPRALLLRYLAAFGPATTSDMQTWSGLQGLAKVVDAMRPELRVLRGPGGRELFDLPGAPYPSEDVQAPVRFLPAFDNLLLAYKDRTRVLAEAHRDFVFPSGLRVEPTFSVDGFVAGTWRVTRKKDTATLTLSPFTKLPKSVHHELSTEADALIRFVEDDAATFDVVFKKA